MNLTELRDEITTLVQSGTFKYSNLSAASRDAFRELFMTGRSFTPQQVEVLRRFWFKAVAPTHPAMIAANELLPPDRNIVPVQANNGNWNVCMDILTDEPTWGPIFPFLKDVIIHRLDPDLDFPTNEVV